jgi:hypothetical protein
MLLDPLWYDSELNEGYVDIAICCDIQKNTAKRNDQCAASADLGGYEYDLLPFS